MAKKTDPSIRKIAVLMVALGPKVAGKVMKKLPEELIEAITSEISELRLIPAGEKRDALMDFVRMRKSASGFEFGGEDSAKSILEEAVGRRQADSIINRATGFSNMSGFENLKKVDHLTVVNYLKNEHPQTIALVLAHVDPRFSGPLMAQLPPSMQGQVAHKIATLDKPNKEALKVVEEVVSSMVQGEFQEERRKYGGKKQVADILNEIEQESWLEIIDDMRDIDDECATEVKNLMFVFEDLTNLDDIYIQEILKEIKGKDLALALKGAPENIQEKIFNNLSKRAGAGIREDMEYMGPVPLAEVEDAQGKVVGVVRKLMDNGVITIGKGGGGAQMVT